MAGKPDRTGTTRNSRYYCSSMRTNGEPCRNYRLTRNPAGTCRFHTNPEVVESLRRRREVEDNLQWAATLVPDPDTDAAVDAVVQAHRRVTLDP